MRKIFFVGIGLSFMLSCMTAGLAVEAQADDGATSALLFYDPDDGGGALTCNQLKVGRKSPNVCEYDKFGKLNISRAAWGGGSAVILKTDLQRPEIEGDCAASVIVSELEHNYNLTPTCRAAPMPARKDATGTVLLDEWFTDLPWHQKLSTKDSNLIETPFVLPFEALPKGQCPGADTETEESRCMLRYGVVNVMAMHRTDTLYADGESSTPKDCENNNCVEVKLNIQRFHTLTDNAQGYAADIIKNNSYKHTRAPHGTVPSLGFAITEATIFAPWRAWYTGHYCVADVDNIADSVCYEDYFTTQLVAPADPTANQEWLRDYPAIFSPTGSEGIFTKFCGENEDHCVMYLGKVDWLENATRPMISNCKSGTTSVCEADVQEKTDDLDRQFNASIQKFPDNGRYPWDESAMNMTEEIDNNPYIGFYQMIEDVPGTARTESLYKAKTYVLPKRCTKEDYLKARQGTPGKVIGDQLDAIKKLADCTLNFEVHTSGFHEQWKELWGGDSGKLDADEISDVFEGIDANQYGRTMFMLAGIPEQHIPVSYRILDDELSIYDKVYNASLYTQYIPLVNPAEQVLKTKSYDEPFWHAIFMSNHMNQTPDHFIRGIRGRTLWHNEYRSNFMYEAAVQSGPSRRIAGTRFENILEHVDFPAGFQVADAEAWHHGNTCDSCHIRNGSGIPLMPNGLLPQIHLDRGMNAEFEISHDYTYTNQELPSMKMVLFDLKGDQDSVQYHHLLSKERRENTLDSPVALYHNRIMNFYGNSFHVNQHNHLPTYAMKYVEVKAADGFEVVETLPRGKYKKYIPKRIEVGQIDTGDSCTEIIARPDDIPADTWPRDCDDVSGEDIQNAIENGEIGFLHLLGRRLGNTPMIEMVPNEVMLETVLHQVELFGGIEWAGDIRLTAGTRVGKSGEYNYRDCSSGEYGEDQDDCYLARWGWIGDRASLEDQIANAAIVEMGVSSIAGFQDLHPAARDEDELVRYDQTPCGPANAKCLFDKENSDISEQEIRDMATYQRWIGIPNRSEYQVTSQIVQDGEELFERLNCSSCHVIDKIPFDNEDNILPDEERENLAKLQIRSGGLPEYPFISYLGTDLLVHDMGYLSQVAAAPAGVTIRDKKTGVIKKKYFAYVQRIRTPALKGLRFNRFVTDSDRNTQKVLGEVDPKNVIPGCDFLLHDGRACDAIEATFLHDGPAIKALETIQDLNELTEEELKQLRAFLYSL